MAALTPAQRISHDNFSYIFCGVEIDYEKQQLNTSLALIPRHRTVEVPKLTGINLKSVTAFLKTGFLRLEDMVDVAGELSLPMVCRQVALAVDHAAKTNFLAEQPGPLKIAQHNLTGLRTQVELLPEAPVQEGVERRRESPRASSLRLLDKAIATLSGVGQAATGCVGDGSDVSDVSEDAAESVSKKSAESVRGSEANASLAPTRHHRRKRHHAAPEEVRAAPSDTAAAAPAATAARASTKETRAARNSDAAAPAATAARVSTKQQPTADALEKQKAIIRERLKLITDVQMIAMYGLPREEAIAYLATDALEKQDLTAS